MTTMADKSYDYGGLSSTFFRLPVELRFMVYEHMVPRHGKSIHVSVRSTTDQRLASITCIAERDVDDTLNDWDTDSEWQEKPWGSSHTACHELFKATYDIESEPSTVGANTGIRQSWLPLMLISRTLYREFRDFLCRRSSFRLEGLDLVSPQRFFNSVNPNALKATKRCTLYWKTQIPMFIRELVAQSRSVTIDIQRLIAIESRWHAVCEKLSDLEDQRWADVQLHGRTSYTKQFEIDISALPRDATVKLREATISLPWSSDYFCSTIDLVSYKVTIRSSSTSDQEYAKIQMYLPQIPFTIYVSGGHNPGRRRQIGAKERFRRRRERREQEELARRSETNTSQGQQGDLE